MKEESHNPGIDPKIEARIVALVLGEASDFERDELNRLINERPELAAVKEQMQSVHGLLRDVGSDESVARDDDWKLSAERRNAILAVIDGDAEEQSARRVVNEFPEKRRSVKGDFFRNLARVAAALCVVAFLGSMAMHAFFNYGWIGPVRYRQMASNSTATRDPKDDSKHLWGDGPAPIRKSFITDDGIAGSSDEKHLPSGGVEFDYEKEMRSAGSVFRGRSGADATLPSPDDRTDEAPNDTAGRHLIVPGDAVVGHGALVNSSAPPQQAAGSGARVADNETEWLEQFDGDGNRPTDSRPTVPIAGNGELSMPTFAHDSVELNAFDAAESAESTVSIPDGGTVLLGGIRRSSGGPERGVYGQPPTSSPVKTELESGVETLNDESEPTTALDLIDSPVLGRTPEDRRFATFDENTNSRAGIRQGLAEQRTAPGLYDQDSRKPESGVQRFGVRASDPNHKFFDERPPQSGDASLTMPNVSGTSGIIGDEDIDGIVVDSEMLGGGALGGGGGALSISGRGSWSSENDESEANKSSTIDGEYGAGVSAETARSERLVAETDGRVESYKEAEEFSGDKLFEADGYASPQTGPASKPHSSSNDLKMKGTLGVANRHKEELTLERIAGPSDDDVSRLKTRISNGRGFYASPVTGTVKGQPRGEWEVGQAQQRNDWGLEQTSETYHRQHVQNFSVSSKVTRSLKETDQPAATTRSGVRPGIEERVKNSLGNISVLNDFARNTDIAGAALPDSQRSNVDHNRLRPKSELEGENDDLPRRPSQSAIAGKSQWFGYVPPMLEDNSESTWPSSAKKSAAPAVLNEENAEEEAFSTFSLHVGDVSFKLARAALARGEWPEAAKVRIEEFVNAFDYGDPMPSPSEKVSCRLEQSIHPFLQQRNVLRVSMRTAAAGRSSNTPLRLTFLLDNSGSMERTDRQQTVRRAFALLAQQLKPIDQVTLISFARQPRLLADKVSGAQSRQLVELIHDLPSEGGTNIEAALQLAFEKAREQQDNAAQNRIVLLTDGAVNLGDANPDSLSRMITAMRNAGIAFDAAGISAEGLNDEVLEALSRKGDGRYYLLDFPEAADEGFARQIAGALRPSAKNVKVQIEFNPKRVGRYKLLGFEKHLLKQEDFRNDKVDAAEMAAAEAGVAVYQFEAKPDGEGDVGSVSVRFRDLSTGQMVENCWPIPYEADAPRPDQAAPSLRIATSAALLAAKLRGGPLSESVDLKALSNLIAGLPERDRNTDRVRQLQMMIQQARQVSGK